MTFVVIAVTVPKCRDLSLFPVLHLDLVHYTESILGWLVYELSLIYPLTSGGCKWLTSARCCWCCLFMFIGSAGIFVISGCADNRHSYTWQTP